MRSLDFGNTPDDALLPGSHWVMIVFRMVTKKASLKGLTFDNVRNDIRPKLKKEIYFESVLMQRVQTYLRTLRLPS